MTEEIHKIMELVFGSIVILFGLVGNLVSFIVYSRKSFQKFSSQIYLRAMTVIDSFNLFFYMHHLISEASEQNFQFIDSITCRIHVYLSYVIPCCSIFILMILSVDRVVCIIYHNSMIRKKKVQICLILVGLFYNFLFYIIVLIIYDLNRLKVSNDKYSCSCDKHSGCGVVKWIDLANSVIVPFLLMTTCSIISLYNIKKSKNRIQNQNKTHQLQINNHNSKNVHFVLISFLLNIKFLIFQLPISIYDIIIMNEVDFSDEKELFYTISLFVFYSHFSLSLVVHLTFNSKFRSEFCHIFHLKKKIRPNPKSNPVISHF
jgi:hypothetical protein